MMMNGFLSIYGACMVIAALIAWRMHGVGVRRYGLRKGTRTLSFVLCGVLAVLLARVNYMLASPYGLMGGGFFSLQPFEYAFCGAVLGVIVGGVLTALVTRQSIGYTLDAAAAGGMTMIVLARAAETFADFGWGAVVTDERLARFPFAVPDMFDQWHLSVFYLEAILALIIAVAALCGKLRAPGVRFSRALLWWSMAQLFCEMLRAESISRGFVRVQQVECVLIALALMLIWARRMHMPKKPLVIRSVIFAVCVGVIALSQFAMDKLTDFIPVWGSYAVMGAACIVIGVTVQTSMKTKKAWIGRMIGIE